MLSGVDVGTFVGAEVDGYIEGLIVDGDIVDGSEVVGKFVVGFEDVG